MTIHLDSPTVMLDHSYSSNSNNTSTMVTTMITIMITMVTMATTTTTIHTTIIAMIMDMDMGTETDMVMNTGTETALIRSTLLNTITNMPIAMATTTTTTTTTIVIVMVTDMTITTTIMDMGMIMLMIMVTATATSMYTTQLAIDPISDIFAGLMPDQKTKFTWLIAHSSYAFFIWFQGMRTGSLGKSPAVGWGYMMLFDAFGIFNSFVTSVVLTDRNLRKSTVKNPFGVQRYEVLLGLCNAIFLLFIGMNMLKESLEHLMLEGHHGGDHESSAGIPLIWTLLGLGVTLVSAVGYQNHHQFCQLMGTGSTLASLSFDHSVKGNSRTLTQNVLFQLIRNPFTIMTLSCGLGVLAVSMLPMFEGLDKFIAIGQSIAMFMLGGPLAKTLGMIILQTSPPRALSAVEEAVRQLSTENPAIQRIEKAHVWTNSYGQLIGTLVVSVAKGSDEQSTLASIHQRLHSLLDLGDTQSQKQVDGSSELTVQL
ncbi:Endoplasmic reticulum zinc transporter, partial [Lunasporangiospora selenospora]